ncbi:tRNA-splicing endonuclease subunit sen54 N-term-domain-containing protein [Cristinia sonorae]|uniref:tRNA-splicing endonuclease subunit sen54 N-term-domain-containing protein n=1 Tax=Cristinia sonorae TaxID=1940300 RepID=A0A8K0UW23_9AGAR|nr:tRNA-splicing endonuclease subunit sen54 N-term-domain-containing protein [Cristinia sonorae]
MDDDLEQPSSVSLPQSEPRKSQLEDGDGADAELSSGDEDEGLDWSKLPSSISRPVIPKRGDKDFEPSVHGGSGLQRHVLDRARNAMLDALKAKRNTSSKSISYGIWYPHLARTHVTTARGIHFTTMGHSVARAGTPASSAAANYQHPIKTAKRLELLPEEAIYLTERGSMFCWKATDDIVADGLENMEGAPMTVQQVFAEMIGTEGLSLEKYQVFAYLKRLGYVVMRTKPPSAAYLTAAPHVAPPSPALSLLSKFKTWLFAPIRWLFNRLSRKSSSWHPSIFHHGLTYPAIFNSLRLLPCGHTAPLQILRPSHETPSPYEIFFNVYKPSTPFKKTSPPKPDFQVVVVNARTAPMPTLSELTDLFDVLPDLPPPAPRRRIAYAEQKKQAQTQPAPAPSITNNTTHTRSSIPQPPTTLFRRFLPFLSWSQPAAREPERKPNPFAVLKQGKKMVVIAAVDSGMISFFAFRQGGFEEFPMA